MEYCDDDREYIRVRPRKTDLFLPRTSVSVGMSLKQLINSAVMAMNSNPAILEEDPVEMMSRLKRHCDTHGQGSANPVTRHEGCIAVVLEASGIRLAPERNVVPAENGVYFWYQAGGTQKKGDFTAFCAIDGVATESVILDAKHSNGTTIYLNDGTFETDVVYIISFTRILPKVKGQRRGERENVCVIALGQDVMSEEDRARLVRWREEIRRLNSLDMGDGSLCLYARSANKYECGKRFGSEFTKECLEKTLAWLESSD